MATAAQALRDVEALLLPVVCLGCEAPLGARHEPDVCCAHCRSRMRRVAPPVCRRCGQPLESWNLAHGEGACDFCGEWPPVLGWARAAVWMEEGPARRLVHALKYGGWRCAAKPMAKVLASECRTQLAGLDALVPVPLGRTRLRERGHNQALELALEIGRVAGLAVMDGALVRSRETRTQTRLDPDGRRANVKGAFLAGAGRIRGARLALVDDVLTTGATLSAAAEALACRKPREIGAVTFARALVPA